jgi:hypothetical protein
MVRFRETKEATKQVFGITDGMRLDGLPFLHFVEEIVFHLRIEFRERAAAVIERTVLWISAVERKGKDTHSRLQVFACGWRKEGSKLAMQLSKGRGRRGLYLGRIWDHGIGSSPEFFCAQYTT